MNNKVWNYVQQSNITLPIYEMSEKVAVNPDNVYVWTKWKTLTETNTKEGSSKESSMFLYIWVQ